MERGRETRRGGKRTAERKEKIGTKWYETRGKKKEDASCYICAKSMTYFLFLSL